ncbi:hypothetical protein I532_04055 [Brevibacillus borstelensis AK1]|uniref:Uncharacterized protein n=1 Tax=Brevibacillus borstelensis AK1 TaxID=1300222 RepID=M8DEH7_9BACL|nr:hypothetical protein [Brevibacillus borstelensis]EMT54749.1 hypothetical protein I532_04055 [Brevibacillus borstelensis AK1]
MTRRHDDWAAPFAVRNLRYLREELAEVERMIPGARRRYFDLVTRKQALQHAIDDNERYLREKGDDANG